MPAKTLGDTRSIEPRDDGAGGSAAGPVLALVLEGRRPLAGSARFPLGGLREVRIGRGSERRFEVDGEIATLRIPDEWMSSRHAVLALDGGRWLLEDPGSKNGLTVNGDAQTRTALSAGDVIEVGKTVLLFHRGETGTASEPPPAEGLGTRDPSLARTFGELVRVAGSSIPVLVSGETGTGKELAARAVHELSRRDGPFVAVNCGALADSVLQSELFGYRKGAFSGADSDRVGLIESSSGGTLFLDEIGDLSSQAQAALLRALQEQEIRPVGATEPVEVDLRVVAASHRDLDARVAAGEFRDDLLARLSGFRVTLPPLRARQDDLGDIISTLLGRLDIGADASLDPDVVRAILRYQWPRNVRELSKVLERAAALAGTGEIRVEHLPAELASALRGTQADRPELTEEERERRARLVALLGSHRGNVSAVAREMGKVRAQIQRWIKRYEIDMAQFRP
jgi:transcriptional regulator with PAS, ATPase and Fis domain